MHLLYIGETQTRDIEETAWQNTINIHPSSGWYFIFGYNPNRYRRHINAPENWPVSHASVTCYP